MITNSNFIGIVYLDGCRHCQDGDNTIVVSFHGVSTWHRCHSSGTLCMKYFIIQFYKSKRLKESLISVFLLTLEWSLFSQ